MKNIVENKMRRPVTVICNSGKAYHLPPKYKGEIASNEIKDNKMFEKLVERHILLVEDVKSSKKAATKKKTKSD